MRTILFLGELPPDSLHGVAISNASNIGMLRDRFDVDIIQENSDLKNHNKASFLKVWNIIKLLHPLMCRSVKKKYHYFYIVFSLSTFGALKTLLYALTFRIASRGKIVLHIHRGDFFLNFYSRKINRIITKIIFDLTDKVIVLSKGQTSEMQFFRNTSFEYLHNTIEFENDFVGKNIGTKKFIYISNYLIDKGIIDLLIAFKELISKFPEITLETYGVFSDENLKSTILKYNSANISINGPITGIDKFDKMASADCLILPSWNEGQPIVLLEAMSLGTPIISTRVGLIPELLGDEYPFLTVPQNCKLLQEKIRLFICYKNINTISLDLRNRYEKYYSQIKHKEKLFDIFS